MPTDGAHVFALTDTKMVFGVGEQPGCVSKRGAVCADCNGRKQSDGDTGTPEDQKARNYEKTL